MQDLREDGPIRDQWEKLTTIDTRHCELVSALIDAKKFCSLVLLEGRLVLPSCRRYRYPRILKTKSTVCHSAENVYVERWQGWLTHTIQYKIPDSTKSARTNPILLFTHNTFRFLLIARRCCLHSRLDVSVLVRIFDSDWPCFDRYQRGSPDISQ